MKRLLLLSLFFLFWGGIARSNNVRFESSARIVSVDADGVATIDLGLKWDNAWRDYNNWDGVWLFFKYREGKDGTWKHVDLETSGHAFVDTSASVKKFTYHVGKSANDATKATGLFVVLAENAYANPRLKCQLKWKLPIGMVKEDFDKVSSVLYAHALEMVYVRTGAYSLGQDFTPDTFASTLINSEKALSVNVNTNGDGLQEQPLPADYPKGFDSFYAMKYELGQEQFVRFFNSLLKTQQEELVPIIQTRDENNYIFGNDATRATKRNGITLATKTTDGKPHKVACDLNRDGIKNAADDGQNIPCAFMNIHFLNTYCAWSGLRPMSELEFEKSCRRPYPFKTLANEYVWGSTSAPIPVTQPSPDGINTSGEMPESGNSSSGGSTGASGYQNPVRSGSFAAVPYTGASALDCQYRAGVTYWGLMEMGGNLKEIVASATHDKLTRDGHGLGAYSKTLWSETTSHYGYRGGGFLSRQESLQTSNRSEIGAITSAGDNGESSVGFRGVRSFSFAETGISLVAGSIAPHNICGGRDILIIEETPASLVGGDGEEALFTYEWYINDDKMVPDFNGFEYVLRNVVPGKKYIVARRAICQYGSTADFASCEFVIPTITVNLDTCYVESADNTINTMLISLGEGVTNEVVYDWFYLGDWIGSGASFKPTSNMFKKDAGFLDLSYRATLADCPTTIEGSVKAFNFVCGESDPEMTLNLSTCIVGYPDASKRILKFSIGEGFPFTVNADWYYKGKKVGSGNPFTPTAGMFGGDLGNLQLDYRAILSNCPYDTIRDQVTVYNVNCSGLQIATNISSSTLGDGQTFVARLTEPYPYTTTFEWLYNGVVKGTGASFTPTYSTFGNYASSYTLNYRVKLAHCSSYTEGSVRVNFVCGRSALHYSNNTHRTATINGRCWMTENMKVGGLYDGTYSPKYGNYITWDQARSVCPSGWRLPSKTEFDAIIANGQRGFFQNQLGGYRSTSGHFSGVGSSGGWWSSWAHDGTYAWALYLGSGSYMDIRNDSKRYGYSVRCVRN